MPRALLHALLMGVCALMALGSAWADDALVVGTPEERAALSSFQQGKPVLAREQAQTVLKRGPSLFGTYVLAAVHHRYEANHPRARFLLVKAREMVEAAYGETPKHPEARRWHKRILLRLEWVLSGMDERTAQLAVLERYAELYTPPETTRQIWPLMKLGRFDDARAIGKHMIYSDDADERERAYNGLMAVEDEARNRKASYEWGKRGRVDSHGEACIINMNLALAARRAFKPDEAEAFDLAALKTKDGSCPSSPYHQLVSTYLIAGEFSRSLSAFKELRKVSTPAHLRVQSEMSNKARLVELLYALGQFDEAKVRAQQIIEAPDRAGTTSASSENLELANTVLYWAVASAQLERMREQISSRPFLTRMSDRFATQGHRAARWEKRRQGLRLAATPKLVVDMVRPYYTDVLAFYAPTLFDMLGEGAAHVALNTARSLEPDYQPTADAFLDAFEGELAWREGEPETAQRLGTRALEHLPKQTVLLRLRVQTWLGDLAWRSGDAAMARRHLHEVLRVWPTALRLLHSPLPVVITHRGGPLAEAAATRLLRSPRFTEGDVGFTVEIIEDGGALDLCLRGQGGFQYTCTHQEVDDEDALPAALDAFHDETFSPQIELTQADVNSLDGRTDRMDAAQAVDQILRGGQRERKAKTP